MIEKTETAHKTRNSRRHTTFVEVTIIAVGRKAGGLRGRL